MSQNLTLCTYNCRGNKDDTAMYIRQLLSKADIVLLQEHWLLESELTSFGDKIGNVSIAGVSGMDQSKLLAGRPYGGCAIVHNKSTLITVNPTADGVGG